MSNRHPIDEHFSRKLQDFAASPPMHIWERIEQQRVLQQQQNLWRKRWSLVILFLVLASTVFTAYQFIGQATKPALGNFPIRVQPVAHSPEDPAAGFSTTIENRQPLSVSASLERQEPKVTQPALLEDMPLLAAAQPFDQLTPTTPAPTETALAEPVKNTLLRQASLPLLPSARYNARRHDKFPENIKCAAFNPGEKGKWFLDLTASPDWSFRTLRPKDRQYTEYVASREATESPDFNYSAGMRVSYEHPSGWSGRVGLNYSQINEKFEFNTENEEVITIRNIYGPAGDVVGTDTLIETSTLRNISNNRFQTLDIPLLAGYQKDLNEKWSLGINAGVLLNLAFQSKGDFLSPNDMQPVSFDSEQPNSFPAFRDKLGLGWYLGASLSYRISPRMQLLVEPHLKSYPKTVTNDQYMVSQKYLLTGLSVGLRHEM